MDNFLTNVPFTTSGALVDLVDKKIFVSLRDGKKLIGVLRSYDQFANLVLQDTIERIYVDINKNHQEDVYNGIEVKQTGSSICQYSDIWRGIYLVRGENVVLLGEIDLDKEDEVLKRFKKENSIEKTCELQSNEMKNQIKMKQDREFYLFNSFGFSKEGEEDDRY